MKNIYNRFWLAVVVMLCGVTASAQQFEVDGVRYSLDYYGNYAIVFSSEAEGGYTGDIVIPSSVVYNGKNYPVKAIHESAFKENRNLTSVVIPEGITEIPYQGFYGCNNLVSVTIPKSVTTILGSAFFNCWKLVSITIPEGVETIYKNTFLECRSLTSVVIPNSVTKIDNYAFSGCQNLTSVDMPDYATWIGEGTFKNCKKITSIDIPEGIYIIKYETFWGCQELTTVTLPSTLETIEYRAFTSCWNLTDINIPTNVKSIEHEAFSDCTNLEHINLPKGLTKISPSLFNGCKNLNNIEIPEGVTEIGSNAFYWCQGITSIVIPHSVTKISTGAFSGCRNLKDIAISENISSLGDGAFRGCKSITSFSVPQKITEIENNLFSGCDKLESITLPEGITKIGEHAFSYCYNLSSINLPDNITKIGRCAFLDCRSLTHITIPKGVEEIKAWTFGKCKSLKTIDIPEGVTEIGREAFEHCGITSITLPKSLTEIEYWAFLNCDSLHTIVCKALVPPLCSHDIFTFDNTVKSNCTLFVPDDSITAYQAAEEWKNFYNIYPLSLKDKKFALTYLVDGEEYRKDSVKLRDTITLIEEPTKEGHTFSGWGEVPERMPANDLTVEGTFTPNKYLVTFKIDGEVIVSDSLTYGTAIVIPETPEREGHTFSGWGEVPETVPADDITYEANYTINSYTLTYTVDSNTVWTDSVPYGTKIIALEAPTKEGYTFSGWSEAPETMPAGDVTISGTFTINKYLVTFKIGDEMIAADSLEYGATIVAPEAPEKEGHTFNGWGEMAETVPAGDVTYEGSYTINIYKVYYYVGEEQVHTAEVAYGEAIPEYIYEPTGEGDVFEGWVGETYETMPAHDVTYVANITNGIEQSEISNHKSEMIFDLMGRKVTDTENLKGGIYIVNGKKVICQ